MNETQGESYLLIDLSNSWFLVGLFFPRIDDKEKRLRYFSSEAFRCSFQAIAPCIQSLLSEANITKPTGIIVSSGPGSFTGSRLGIAFARNLAQLWKLPIIGIPSTYFYSYDLAKRYFHPLEAPLALALEGRQGRVYTTLWPKSPTQKTLLRTPPAIRDEYIFSSLERYLSLAKEATAVEQSNHTVASVANSFMDQCPYIFSNDVQQVCAYLESDMARYLAPSIEGKTKKRQEVQRETCKGETYIEKITIDKITLEKYYREKMGREDSKTPANKVKHGELFFRKFMENKDCLRLRIKYGNIRENRAGVSSPTLEKYILQMGEPDLSNLYYFAEEYALFHKLKTEDKVPEVFTLGHWSRLKPIYLRAAVSN